MDDTAPRPRFPLSRCLVWLAIALVAATLALPFTSARAVVYRPLTAMVGAMSGAPDITGAYESNAKVARAYYRGLDVIGMHRFPGFSDFQQGEVERLAKVGDAHALRLLAYDYYEGARYDKNMERSWSYSLLAADAGHVSSQMFVGRELLLRRGEDTKALASGSYWLHRATNNGDVLAASVLGEEYLDGDRLEQDCDLALELLTRGQDAKGIADPDSWSGKRALATFHYRGCGDFGQDYRKAERLYVEASELTQDGIAEYWLGWMAEKGYGRSCNRSLALAWYGESLAKGYARAEEGHKRMNAELRSRLVISRARRESASVPRN